MRIVHFDEKINKPLKQEKQRLPMYKDIVFMAELRKSIIDDHNNKIKKRLIGARR